jgi:hypothetical protein
MNLREKNQSQFSENTSIMEIIAFIESNKKTLLFFTLLGGLLGAGYERFYIPKFEGKMTVLPAKIMGDFIEKPKNLITKLETSTYYSRETFAACSDNKDEGGLFSNIKISLQPGEELIVFKLAHKDSTKILNCLNSVFNDILRDQSSEVESFIKAKKSTLSLLEEKINYLTNFGKTLINNQNDKSSFSESLLYTNMLMTNNIQLKEIINQFDLINADLSKEKTQEALIAVPIEVKKISSLKIKIFLGLFLGFSLGFIICHLKKMQD